MGFDDFLTDFTTPKYVVVRSKSLRIPELIVAVSFFFFLIAYKFIYGLGFMRGLPVSNEMILEVRQPTRNFETCSTSKGDCEAWVESRDEYDYCTPKEECSSDSEGAIETKNAGIDGDRRSCKRTSRCRLFDYKDVTPVSSTWSQGLFVTTSMLIETSRRCPDEDECERPWTSVKKEEVLVQGIESFQIKLRHRFRTSDKGLPVAVHGAAAMGLLQPSTGGPPLRIDYIHDRCDNDAKTHQGSFQCSQMEHWRTRYPHVCGDRVSASRETCMTTRYADYISLGLLLRAAGINLSEGSAIATETNRTLREDGVIMSITTSFTNLDPRDFWSWPFGSMSKYTLYPTRSKHSDADDAISTRVSYSEDGKYRTTISSRGVLILVDGTGTLADFHLLACLTTLVVCSAVLAYSRKFVNYVLIKVYGWTQALRHVAFLHGISVHTLTPLDIEVSCDISAKEYETLQAKAFQEQMSSMFSSR
eukprot:TRINITY_DN63017_c0_g1_i1.p1 TRINITY_DN63017_c0_g1~~TRINITY_DN63017_c0_g1_i1.p1  ORF type:complete len:475 (+),score=64.16 TRINITY_DN63017_c0_g1_i1:79-1503(+)